MSKENIELARKGYDALIRGDLDAFAKALAPDLTWHWWEHGPWDCHSRDEALELIQERLSQNAIGELVELIDVDDEHIVAVTRLRPDSEIRPADLGVSEDHHEFANVVTIRAGKVVAMHDYKTRADALSSLGQSDSGA